MQYLKIKYNCEALMRLAKLEYRDGQSDDSDYTYSDSLMCELIRNPDFPAQLAYDLAEEHVSEPCVIVDLATRYDVHVSKLKHLIDCWRNLLSFDTEVLVNDIIEVIVSREDFPIIDVMEYVLELSSIIPEGNLQNVYNEKVIATVTNRDDWKELPIFDAIQELFNGNLNPVYNECYCKKHPGWTKSLFEDSISVWV